MSLVTRPSVDRARGLVLGASASARQTCQVTVDLNPQAETARRYLEVPVIFAALLVLPVIVIEASASDPFWIGIAVVTNWVIWFVFAFDLLVMLYLVDDRLTYLKSAWLDVFIVLTSFPPLTSIGATRILRLWRIGPALRMLRLVRLAAVVTRGGKAVRGLFQRKGLGYVIGVTVFAALGFGVLISLVEPDIGTPWDGIWWAFVTATTVGYGDISPKSASGRIVAVVLMLFGIGLLGVFTGLVAAYFVEEDDVGTVAEIARLHERLDGIEDALGIARKGE